MTILDEDNEPSPKEMAMDDSLPLWKIKLSVSFDVEMTLHSPNYDSAIINAMVLCQLKDAWTGPGVQVSPSSAICCTANKVEPPPICDGQGFASCK